MALIRHYLGLWKHGKDRMSVRRALATIKAWDKLPRAQGKLKMLWKTSGNVLNC